MRRTISFMLICLSLTVTSTLFVTPANTTIHPDIDEGGWFIYDSSIVIRPSFGIFEFSFEGRYRVTITNITGDNITTSVEVLSSSLPMNVSDIFLPIIAIPTEMLVNDTLEFENTTTPFTSSVETDASKYWRGIPVKIADLGSIVGSFIGSGATAKFKFDATTGLLYQVAIAASLDLGGGIALLLSIDVSLVEANPMYRESMLTRYDHYYDALFFFSDIITAPWFIPAIILSAVIITLAVVLMSTRKQVVKTTPIVSKAKMTRDQERRSRMKSKAGKGMAKRG